MKSYGWCSARYSNSVEIKEPDICGQEYINLITSCFQYSSYFSLSAPAIYDSNLCAKYYDIPDLRPFLKFEYSTLQDVYYGTLYTPHPTMIRVYYCCKDTQKALLTYHKTLFSWDAFGCDSKSPEDLTFFRKDGTVFMQQLSHEGECMLYPRAGENVDKIVQTGSWTTKEQDKEWLQSVWTAVRIAPQPLPPKQQKYIEDRRKDWQDWPSSEIKFQQELIDELRQKKKPDAIDLHMMKKHTTNQLLLKKLYREKWGHNYPD